MRCDDIAGLFACHDGDDFERYAAAAQFTRIRLRKCIPSPNEHVGKAQPLAKKMQLTVSGVLHPMLILLE